MQSPLKLLPREIGTILHDHGPGHVVMVECPICGRLQWERTHSDQPNQVSVEIGSASVCSRCYDVQQRAPEVFLWVAGVVGRLRRQIRDQVPSFDPTHPDKAKPEEGP